MLVKNNHPQKGDKIKKIYSVVRKNTSKRTYRVEKVFPPYQDYSANWLEKIAIIDCSYFLIEQELKSLHQRQPFEAMIDKATGFDKERTNRIVSLVRKIIRAKKKIDADYSYDQACLEKLTKME